MNSEKVCQCTVSLQAVRAWMEASPGQPAPQAFRAMLKVMRPVDDKVEAVK